MVLLASKLDELQKKIDQHPGQAAFIKWNNHKRFYLGVYMENRKAFYKHVSAPAHDDNLSIELIQNVRPPLIREQYINELLRLFHNYLASAFTLVDLSRRLIECYKKTNFETEYQKKRSSWLNHLNTIFYRI